MLIAEMACVGAMVIMIVCAIGYVVYRKFVRSID
jgi:hypothetical protein